jgi:flagellar motility protein MotE (MotC chaperone)
MRLRLLRVVLFAGGLLLTVRVGSLWQEVSVDAGRDSVAETTEESGSPEAAPDEAAPSEAAPETAAETATEAAALPPEGENLLAPPGGPADPLSYTDEEIELLQSLAKRRDELDAREQGLGEREALIAATEKRIDDKLAELKQVQTQIEGLVKQHDTEQESQLGSLVKIYENMKPKDAAQIFEELEMDVLLDVVERMKERKVAPVLALMNPEKAREVTLELAQRRELPLPK